MLFATNFRTAATVMLMFFHALTYGQGVKSEPSAPKVVAPSTGPIVSLTLRGEVIAVFDMELLKRLSQNNDRSGILRPSRFVLMKEDGNFFAVNGEKVIIESNSKTKWEGNSKDLAGTFRVTCNIVDGKFLATEIIRESDGLGVEGAPVPVAPPRIFESAPVPRYVPPPRTYEIVPPLIYVPPPVLVPPPPK